jgi:hypothetical protein
MLKPVSTKRAKQNRVYSARRLVFLEAWPQCQFPLGCTNAATEVHHMRGRVGGLLLDESLWLALCHDCHVNVTEHPTFALAVGTSVSRLGITA